MKTPDTPDNETARQAALNQSGLLDTNAEERFDRITRMARRAFRVPIALISLIDTNRQWFKSCQGLNVTETSRGVSFCGHAIHQSKLLVIEDALNDERFRDNPLVTEDPFIRFYAGAPLHDKNGFRLGTLCVIDRKPRSLDQEERTLLRELADCVEHELRQEADYAAITADMNNLSRVQRQNRALSILSELASEPETDDDARIESALQLGAEFLDLPLGIVSEITSDVYSIRWFVAPDDGGLDKDATFPLEDTYCSLLLKEKESLSISHMAESPHRQHRCYSAFGLESYIAAPIFVGDRLFGTLNFSSPEPRKTVFSDIDVMFVTLLARWVVGVLERRLSVQMLTKLVEQTPGMLYQFRRWPDGRSAFPFASSHIRDIYGLESEDVKHDASEAFTRIHPDDLAGLLGSVDRSADTLSIWQDQYRVRDGETGWRWVEGKASPERMPDKSVIWHGYIADIDDNKRTELALQARENQLRRFYELSPIGIALVDYLSGKVLDINQALIEPTGYTQQELMALAFQDFAADNPQKHWQVIRDQLRESGRFGPYELGIRRSDHSTYPAVVRGMRISDTNGRPLLWILIEDVSERRKVDRMKSEFISTVSHELRTPLTSIAGSLGLIVGGSLGQLPDQVNRMVTIAYRNSQQLILLVDDLLDMEKLVSGKMRMQLAPTQVLPVIKEAIDRLNTYAVEREVCVRLDNTPTAPTARVDASRLNQAFANLLSNAIKFSPDKGEVIVRFEEVDQYLRVSVADRGPGVPESFRPRIFQKFAQADSSATRQKGGTGLGLAITREIMSQMGGSAGFESVVGQGATFWLDLPLSG